MASTTTRNRFNGLERMFENKVPRAFGACFAPSCTTLETIDENPMGTTDMTCHGEHKDALGKMQAGIKQKIVESVGPWKNQFSGEEDEAFLRELNLTEGDVCTEKMKRPVVSEEVHANWATWESGSISDLNTIGEETLGNLENKGELKTRKDVKNGGSVLGSNNNVTQGYGVFSSKRLKHLPGSYKQSVRSKFDYYRKHHTFVGDSTTVAQNANEKKQQEPASTENAVAKKPVLAPIATQVASEDIKNEKSTGSPGSQRNELAKQILIRQHVQPMVSPQTTSRVAVDP